MSLPKTVSEMRTRLGQATGWNGYQQMVATFSKWLTDAAEERWPDEWVGDEGEWLRRIWLNAVERWGLSLLELSEDLAATEQSFLQNGEARA